MDIYKKIIIVKFLFMLLLYFLADSITDIGFEAIYSIYYAEQGVSVIQREIFLPLVITICLLSLWKVQKTEFILLILGEIFVLIGNYNFFISKTLFTAIQITGLVLFIIAFIKISFFLIGKKSDQFIQSFFKASQ